MTGNIIDSILTTGIGLDALERPDPCPSGGGTVRTPRVSSEPGTGKAGSGASSSGTDLSSSGVAALPPAISKQCHAIMR